MQLANSTEYMAKTGANKTCEVRKSAWPPMEEPMVSTGDPCGLAGHHVQHGLQGARVAREGVWSAVVLNTLPGGLRVLSVYSGGISGNL